MGTLNTYRVRCSIVVWWVDDENWVREHVYRVDRMVKALDERYAGAALNDEYRRRFREQYGYWGAYLSVWCRDFCSVVVQPHKAERSANEVVATMLPGM
jgi:hypothetical protein